MLLPFSLVELRKESSEESSKTTFSVWCLPGTGEENPLSELLEPS